MLKDVRDAFFESLYEDALVNKDIMIISADADAFALRQFKKNIPNRYINVGVTEQNMINVAAGLALAGKIVFVYSIIPFATMRCYEQIKFNLSGMNLPVKIVGVGTGFSFGFDGPSHHGINDIALMRSIPNMQILNPCDETSTVLCYKKMLECNTPSYIRLDKGKFDDVYSREIPTDFYKFLSSHKASEILVVSSGYTTHLVKNCILQYQEELPTADYVDICQIKPFPYFGFDMYKHVIVIEENYKTGGLSSIIAEKIMEFNKYRPQVHSISIVDKEHLIYGDREFLLQQNGITIEYLYKVMKELKSE